MPFRIALGVSIEARLRQRALKTLTDFFALGQASKPRRDWFSALQARRRRRSAGAVAMLKKFTDRGGGVPKSAEKSKGGAM